MAVRQLAGPFRILSAGIDGAPGSPPGFDIGNTQWYADRGLVAGIDASGQIISIDGIFQPIHSYDPFTIGWWVNKRQLLSIGAPDDSTEYVREPKALVATKIEQIYATQWLHKYVRVGDKRYFFDSGAGVVKVLEGGVITTESAGFGLGSCSVWAGRNDQELFFYQSDQGLEDDTIVGFYNIVSHEIVAQYHLGMGCMEATYAQEHKVIISRHNVDVDISELRIWSTEVKPTLLTPATVISGTVKAGLLATFQVQALGAHDDPCPNELIDWSIDGSGSLLAIQSRTDADGFATVRVKYGLGVTDPSTIIASLQC